MGAHKEKYNVQVFVTEMWHYFFNQCQLQLKLFPFFDEFSLSLNLDWWECFGLLQNKVIYFITCELINPIFHAWSYHSKEIHGLTLMLCLEKPYHFWPLITAKCSVPVAIRWISTAGGGVAGNKSRGYNLPHNIWKCSWPKGWCQL